VPPPELTKSGKPLTKKEKKAVNIYMFFWWNTLFINLRSSRNQRLDLTGLTSPLQQRPIVRGYIAKWRLYVYVINLIQSDSTARMKEKVKASKDCPNTSL
jgi:hypothetical protein